MAAGVRLAGVSAGYGRLRRRRVLEGVDLVAPRGRVTAVVGPNGVGKTTLFRVLLGFLEAWDGEVEVEGHAPRENRVRHGVGYLPEAVALPPGYSVGGLLREGARLARLVGGEAASAVEGALEVTGLSGVRGRPLETLSRGMGRRAALAFALLGDPRVILLDEPFSGLDPRSRAALRETIAAVPARGATVLLTSHDLPEVQRGADVAFILSRGRVVRRLEGSELARADLERLVLDAEPLP